MCGCGIAEVIGDEELVILPYEGIHDQFSDLNIVGIFKQLAPEMVNNMIDRQIGVVALLLLLDVKIILQYFLLNIFLNQEKQRSHLY